MDEVRSRHEVCENLMCHGHVMNNKDRAIRDTSSLGEVVASVGRDDGAVWRG